MPLETIVIVVAVVAGVALLVVLALSIAVVRLRKREKRAHAHFTAEGDVNIALMEGDLVLQRGKNYTAGEKDLNPGVHLLLSTSEIAQTFKVRVGGIVREYRHGDSIILSEGEEICPVSAAVVLRERR